MKSYSELKFKFKTTRSSFEYIFPREINWNLMDTIVDSKIS